MHHGIKSKFHGRRKIIAFKKLIRRKGLKKFRRNAKKATRKANYYLAGNMKTINCVIKIKSKESKISFNSWKINITSCKINKSILTTTGLHICRYIFRLQLYIVFLHCRNIVTIL